jgi:DNA-binding FadR family transcriptional regulator
MGAPGHVSAPTADRVVSSTAEEILSGRLPAGAKLPSERDLAQQYNVGRPLIREALRTLAEMGLIETIPARGTFVRAVDDPATHRGGGIAIRRRGVTAHQLSEARLLLETSAARYAADRATPDDLARLRVTLERMDSSTAIQHVEDDLTFHLDVATAAHNPVLEMMLESIAVPTAALMVRSVGDPQVMLRSQPYHRLCLEAIEAHDAEAAAERMRAHLTVAQDLYGDDYERSVDELARHALTQLRATTGLDDLVERVLTSRASERRG